MEGTNDPSSPFYDNPKEDNIQVEDQGDLITKFLYEPNHKHYGSGDYLNFINKNYILTHTTDEEAQVMRPMMESVVILNRHLEEKTVWVDSGELEKIYVKDGKIVNPEEESIDGENIQVFVRPILIQKTVQEERFAITIRNLITQLAAITVTAAGREGKYIKDSKTVRLEKEQSIEDKTETRPGFWAKMKKK